MHNPQDNRTIDRLRENDAPAGLPSVGRQVAANRQDGKENLLPCVVFHLLTIFQLQFQLNNNLVPERKAKNPSHRQKSVSVSCKTKG